MMQFELQQNKKIADSYLYRIHIVTILAEIGKDLLEIGQYLFGFLLKIRIRRLDY